MIRWAGHRGMCREWERRDINIIFFNVIENEHLEYIGIDAEITLKWILKR
jgi:hypothetical protein